MATLIKRDSENTVPNVTAPSLDELDSKAAATDTNPSLTRFWEFFNAWAEGRFNDPAKTGDAIADFFAPSMVFDVKSANGHAGLPEFKEYSCDTIMEWFEFIARYNLTDMDITAVASAANPSEIWQRFSSLTSSKLTGKSMLLELIVIYKFEGKRIEHAMVMYADPTRIAALDKEGESDESPQLVRPSFEPHPEPKPVFEAAFAAWSSGEFAKPETKRATYDALCSPSYVNDVSSALLPDVFKVYHGFEGADAWANGVVGQWEFARLDMSVEVGLRPGCVMQKLDCDVKHKVSGKEAKGLVIYTENAYDAAGKCVYSKSFWADPALAASLY